MFEYIKQRILKNLIEEIECLSPTNLELVGNNVVSVIEGQRMIHHGINKDYKPSGYTVDSFSNDSKIIAEYSTDKDYFEDTSKKGAVIPLYNKIENDISHALSHDASNIPNKIYLITSQQEPPSFRSKYNNTLFAKKNGNIIIIYDNRELAKFIYEQSLKSPDFASFYKQFFPGFAQDLDNYEYYGKVPSYCENHVEDYKLIDKIVKHFEDNDICVLYGISGSGKTQMAINYLHSHKNNFENYVWISGEDWKKDLPFSSIQRTRGGTPINIAGIFNSGKTILIIDDCKRIIDIGELSELKKGFDNGSKLLITSQLSKTDKSYLPIPEISDIVAYGIIGEDVTKKTEQLKKVIRLCKFSPLILSTIRSLAEENNISRDELYEEVLRNPTEIIDSEGKSIMRAILGKLEPGMLNALRKIANSGTNTNNSEFLKHFIGTINRMNLQRLSILLPANIPGFLKIHDLVSSSVQDNLNSKEISSAIIEYIHANNANMSPSVMMQIHLCYEMLIKEHNFVDQKDWITYSLLQVDSPKREEIQASLYKELLLPDMDLSSILCIIDSKEAHAYLIEDKVEREFFFKKCIDEYKHALTLIKDDILKVEILHHLGKTLRRCGLNEESLDSFLELLSIEPNMHATYLQIAHIGSQYGVDKIFKERGEEYLRKLLDCVFQDYFAVPLRVSLASIARIRSYKMISDEINLKEEKVKKLSDIIVISSLEGFGQFFEAFVSFTSIFGYHHGSMCLDLIEIVPELLTTPPENVDKKNWLNASEGLTNIAISAFREDKIKLSKKIANTSATFADKIFEKEKLTSFEGRSLAKTYLAANLPQKALLAIDKVPDESSDHWLIYQKSKAQIEMNNPDCHKSAITAFELAEKDDTGKKRISIYYDLLSRSAESIGKKEEAIMQAKLSIDNCNDDKYKKELEKRLNELTVSE
ncbi:MAG: tetratricopeptide repeat protein [Bacteroidetes bacterium]|nr:tetratricopeptide repeat protein [Bacteroidota bacterium]